MNVLKARWGRRLTPVLVAALIGATLGLVLAPSVALAKCQPGRANNGNSYWAGFWRDASGSGTVGGVYSYVRNYSPWVQPGSEVLGWSMITRAGQASSLWAQVGWWEYAYGERHTFVQYTTSPGHWNTYFWSPQATDSYTYYTTLYDGSHFTFQVAGSTIKQVTKTFVPNEGQISGETHTLASQMPGGTNGGAKEYFNDSHIWFTSWVAFDGSGLAYNSTYHGENKSSSLNYYVWDKACAS